MSQTLKHMTWSTKKGKTIIHKRDGACIALTVREMLELQQVMDDIFIDACGHRARFYVKDSRNN